MSFSIVMSPEKSGAPSDPKTPFQLVSDWPKLAGKSAIFEHSSPSWWPKLAGKSAIFEHLPTETGFWGRLGRLTISQVPL